MLVQLDSFSFINLIKNIIKLLFRILFKSNYNNYYKKYELFLNFVI
jgi:hypothetical protein